MYYITTSRRKILLSTTITSTLYALAYVLDIALIVRIVPSRS